MTINPFDGILNGRQMATWAGASAAPLADAQNRPSAAEQQPVQPGEPLSTKCQFALVISASRLLRDSLVEVLGRSGRACSEAATLSEALDVSPPRVATLVLLDSAIPEGPLAATRVTQALPAARVVVFGVAETEEAVLAWVEAGVAGYVPNTASIADLLDQVDAIARGEQVCPSHIAGSLLRRLAAQAWERVAVPSSQALTPREQEIVRLIGAGLSNKDIARRLSISLGTTKSHVHNLFGKLHLQRRAELMVRLGAAVQIHP